MFYKKRNKIIELNNDKHILMKRVSDLKNQLDSREKDFLILKNDFNNYKRQVNGERVRTEICGNCKNGYSHYTSPISISKTVYKCKLDIHCVDFEDKFKTLNVMEVK